MAVRFDGTSFLTRTGNLPSVTSCTLACWGRLSVDRNTFSNILSIEDPNSGSYFSFDTQSDGTSLYFWPVGGTEVSIASLSVGADFFCAISSSGDGNGEAVAYYRTADDNDLTAVPLGAWTAFTPSEIVVGSNQFSEAWNGCAWNVKAWNRALTADELLVESYYRRVVYPANINFHWWLRNANDTVDRSGNGRNPTVTGTLTSEGEPTLWVPRRKVYIPSAAVSGGTFKAAWARGSNVVIQPDR